MGGEIVSEIYIFSIPMSVCLICLAEMCIRDRFNIVAGIIGLVTFLNSALGTSSSRFITITLGRGDISDSKLLVSTIYKVQDVYKRQTPMSITRWEL